MYASKHNDKTATSHVRHSLKTPFSAMACAMQRITHPYISQQAILLNAAQCNSGIPTSEQRVPAVLYLWRRTHQLARQINIQSHHQQLALCS